MKWLDGPTEGGGVRSCSSAGLHQPASWGFSHAVAWCCRLPRIASGHALLAWSAQFAFSFRLVQRGSDKRTRAALWAPQ